MGFFRTGNPPGPITKVMHTHYWTADDPAGWRNFGDWAIEPLLTAVGHRYDPPAAGRPCLFGVGTILNSDHFAAVAAAGVTAVVVWGSGAGPDGRVTLPVEFRAVRGPVTRDRYQLPARTPVGDPVLLFPQLVPLPRPAARGGTVYVNHCGRGDAVVCPPGCDEAVSMRVRPETALETAARIAAADFVVSESFHGCVLAAAYGVPWAPTPDPATRYKYDDLAALLGLPPFAGEFPTPAGAKDWWDRVGRRGRVPDLARVLDAFPKEL